MNNDLGIKLIAVVDLSRLRLYEAKGIKIINTLEELALSVHKEHRHEKGSYHGSSSPNSAFEPHTATKDLEHQEAARIVVDHIDKIISHNADYKELFIAAEPKTLGQIRSHLTKRLKKIVGKEIHKDFAHNNIHDIEHAFFS